MAGFSNSNLYSIRMFFGSDQDSYLSEPDLSGPLKAEPNMISLTNFTNHKQTLSRSSSEKESECWSISDRDILERQIIETNSELLQRAVQEYFDCCLNQPFGSPQSVSNRRTFHFQKTPGTTQEEKTLEALVHSNPLLPSSKKRHLRTLYKQLEELRDLFHEINRIFCLKIGQELVLVIQTLLESKFHSFRQCLEASSPDYLPKMNRISGDQGCEIVFHGGWQIYNEVDEKNVQKIASENTSKIAKDLYFSENTNFLTFKNVNSEVSLQKFNFLIDFLSQNLFMSLSGICQPEQSMFSYISDLYSDSDEKKGEKPSKKIKRL